MKCCSLKGSYNFCFTPSPQSSQGFAEVRIQQRRDAGCEVFSKQSEIDLRCWMNGGDWEVESALKSKHGHLRSSWEPRNFGY